MFRSRKATEYPETMKIDVPYLIQKIVPPDKSEHQQLKQHTRLIVCVHQVERVLFSHKLNYSSLTVRIMNSNAFSYINFHTSAWRWRTFSSKTNAVGTTRLTFCYRWRICRLWHDRVAMLLRHCVLNTLHPFKTTVNLSTLFPYRFTRHHEPITPGTAFAVLRFHNRQFTKLNGGSEYSWKQVICAYAIRPR